MSTTAGLTGLNGQQLVTQLVPSQGMQGQVVHQAATPIGVTTTLASAISQGQVEWTNLFIDYMELRTTLRITRKLNLSLGICSMMTLLNQ